LPFGALPKRLNASASATAPKSPPCVTLKPPLVKLCPSPNSSSVRSSNVTTPACTEGAAPTPSNAAHASAARPIFLIDDPSNVWVAGTGNVRLAPMFAGQHA